MQTYNIHQHIVQDYQAYLKNFITVKNQRIKEKVDEAFREGKFIPDGLIQFNPSFATGSSMADLVSEGLHPEVAEIFGNFNLFDHQVRAIRQGTQGRSFVLTSGTGSGKSLTFLGTIFDAILKEDAPKGLRAVIVYPMNALINSQEEEIKKHELHRCQWMLGMQLGFTKTYNLFHARGLPPVSAAEASLDDKAFEKLLGKDALSLRKHLAKTPEATLSFNEAVAGVLELRRLHVEMDTAVAAAYGWEDIALRHDFYEVDYLPENDRVRYTIHPDARREVLKRLLALNHQIHAEEVKARLWEKKSGGKASGKGPKKKGDDSGQIGLFDDCHDEDKEE